MRDDPPALVFGAREKLRAEGPSLSALAEFARLLGAGDHLLVIGYSFRDDHINQVIRRWTWDPGRQITVVDPAIPVQGDSAPDQFSGPFQRRVSEIARLGRKGGLTVDVRREEAGVSMARMLGS